jgi:hypothetical protein
MEEKTVDDYVGSLESPKAEIVKRIRQVILEAAPDAVESIKWAQTVYESGGPFAYIKAFKSDVNLGFWRGAEIIDSNELLGGTGEKMRHVSLKDMDDIDKDALADFVPQAVRLNRIKGNSTRGIE